VETVQLGASAEDRAEAALVAAGYSIVVRNWTCKIGELDLVAHDRGALVFVEVRSRAAPDHGRGAEMVNRRKRRRIERLATVYLAAERPPPSDVRFDVVSVTADEVAIIRDAWRTGE
jgi:putative endonuclease